MTIRQVEASDAQQVAFDRSDLLGRLDNDEELLEEILAAYVEDIPLQIASLEEAINAQDIALVCRQGHTIKGASGNVGALAMRDASFKIEAAGKLGDMEQAAAIFEQIKTEFERFRQEVGI